MNVKEALSIIYEAILNKETKQQTSYKSKNILYIANQSYLLYGSSVDGDKYSFGVTQFS